MDAAEHPDSSDGKENGSTYAAAEYCEADPVTQANTTEPSGIEVNGDLNGGWKLIMHEESNQYYYWNTVTGETSWEVPTAFAGQTVSGTERDVSHPDAHLRIESATYAYASAVDELGSSHLISEDAGESSSVLEIKNENVETAHVGYNANQALTHSDSAVCISHADPSALSEFGSSLQTSTVSMGQLTVAIAEAHVSNNEDRDKHFRIPTEYYGTADVHSSQLVKCCESLLQRLEALDRYHYF